MKSFISKRAILLSVFSLVSIDPFCKVKGIVTKNPSSSTSFIATEPLPTKQHKPQYSYNHNTETSNSITNLHSHQSIPKISPPSSRPIVIRPELDQWREYEKLRSNLNKDTILPFFLKRPALIPKRLFQVITTLKKARDEWEATAPESLKNVEFWEVPEPELLDSQELKDRADVLCQSMASLGPVCVKLCQTLSQRPDIVGGEASEALKRLQTSNVPFDDDLAMAMIKESLNWSGPIAPGVGIDENDTNEEPLFSSITSSPVAAASLGQVYKGVTHSGDEVAVKVQRPDAMSILAVDYMCFRLVVFIVKKWASLQKGGFTNGKVLDVVDRVATDLLKELDYEREAQNSKYFEESLQFLGFVSTPDVISEYSTKRVLVTKWVQGAHLCDLTEEEGLSMTRMAVEACTASMVLTGYVHADPHEGNLMLANNGNLVFLDFGLMSDVSEDVMEAFAKGIQACLAEDWVELVKAFKATGFINDPVQYRAKRTDVFAPIGYDPVTGEDLGMEPLSKELEKAMNEVEGGTSRFGALATVLNRELSPNWKLFTPPYVLLLIRTYLTLEGISGRIDPDFNIYEMAFPWAIRRSLSPSTPDGINSLRSTLLKEDNRVQWERFMGLAKDVLSNDSTSSGTSTQTSQSTQRQKHNTNINHPNELDSKAEASKFAKTAAMNDAVVSLLGSTNGNILRKALKDLDSTDLIQRMNTKEAREIRDAIAKSLATSTLSSSNLPSTPPTLTSTSTSTSTSATTKTTSTASSSSSTTTTTQAPATTSTTSTNSNPSAQIIRPISEACIALRRNEAKWKKKVISLLLSRHLYQQFEKGPRAVASLVLLATRIILRAMRYKIGTAILRLRYVLTGRNWYSRRRRRRIGTGGDLNLGGENESRGNLYAS